MPFPDFETPWPQLIRGWAICLGFSFNLGSILHFARCNVFCNLLGDVDSGSLLPAREQLVYSTNSFRLVRGRMRLS